MLTTSEYKAQFDNALAKFDQYGGQTANYAQTHASAWAHIASVYAHLWTHMAMFDKKGQVPSALANSYRTKAENYLNVAKSKADGALAYVQLALTNAESAAAAGHA